MSSKTVNITLVEHDGTVHVGSATPGTTLMQFARDIGFPGIVAECGGVCACATCQVYIDEAWISRTGEPSADEKEMLEMANDVNSFSRLSCQITLTTELDGLVAKTPRSQL